MAFLSSIHPTLLPVYPAFDPSQKDRFGLPLVPVIGGETWPERKAREAAARQLARDAFESVATNLGHDEAVRVFAEAAKKRPKGKQANRRKNEIILDCYDAAMSELGNPDGSLPAHVADLLRSNFPDFRHATADSLEKRIRRLLKERGRTRARTAALRALYPPIIIADKCGLRDK
jgi:hypothetical protein